MKMLRWLGMAAVMVLTGSSAGGGTILPAAADGSASLNRNPGNQTVSLSVSDTGTESVVGTFTGNFGGASAAIFEFDISSLSLLGTRYDLHLTFAETAVVSDFSIYAKQGNGSIEFNDWRVPQDGQIITPANSPYIVPMSSTISLADLDLVEEVHLGGIMFPQGHAFQTTTSPFDTYLSNAIAQNWNYLTVVISSTDDVHSFQLANLENANYETARIVNIPEPTGMALLGLGALLAAWRLGRSRRLK